MKKSKKNLIFYAIAIACFAVLGLNTATAGCNPAGAQGYCNLVNTPVGNGEYEINLECEELIDEDNNANS